MCVETLRTAFVFPEYDRFEGLPRFTSKNEMFSHLSFEWPHKCFLAFASEQCYFEMINLRCHMPRFSWKVNDFLGNTTNVCWNPQNRAAKCFSRRSIWGVTCPSKFTLKMNAFPSLSPKKPHKCVLKPSEQCLFFQDMHLKWRFEGSHA